LTRLLFPTPASPKITIFHGSLIEADDDSRRAVQLPLRLRLLLFMLPAKLSLSDGTLLEVKSLNLPLIGRKGLLP